jgi:hypothetical protein
MTTPNTIIADLSHEIDRLRRISNLLLDVAIRAEDFLVKFERIDGAVCASSALLGDLRYAIDEAHHG